MAAVDENSKEPWSVVSARGGRVKKMGANLSELVVGQAASFYGLP